METVYLVVDYYCENAVVAVFSSTQMAERWIAAQLMDNRYDIKAMPVDSEEV